jgi:predicted esterase
MTVPPSSVHILPAGTHGRYVVRDVARGDPAAGLLVGFHGYAQNAATMLADLETIPGVARWRIASVQALHRFYHKSGDVVASWMTSEDRELAIADNIAYVGAVLDRVRPPAEGAPVGRRPPVVFAGFSQGVAMAYRAAARLPGCDGVIVLAGDLPPDVRDAATALPPVLLGRGGGEQWYTREKLRADLDCLRAAAVDVTLCEFDGGHEWTDPFRRAAATFLEAAVERAGATAARGGTER